MPVRPTPLRALTPVEVELKPKLESSGLPTPPPSRTRSSAAPKWNDKTKADPVTPTKTLPGRKGRNPAPIYAPNNDGDSDEEEEEEEEEVEEAYEEDDDEDEYEDEYQDGSEDGVEDEDEDEVMEVDDDGSSAADDDREASMSTRPSPTPSSPIQGTIKKRRRPTGSGKTPTKRARPAPASSDPSGGPVKNGPYTPDELLAMYLDRRPLQVGKEWGSLGETLSRKADLCRKRFAAMDKKIKELILAGKV